MGGDFNKTEPNEVQGREHHQWSQFPFLQVFKTDVYGHHEIGDRNNYLSKSVTFWLYTRNEFVRQLEFYIEHSSRYGYTSVSLCIPCETFNQYKNMKSEMKNFYTFLKSYLYSKGISMNWTKREFYAWKDEYDPDCEYEYEDDSFRHVDHNIRGAVWAANHDYFPVIWFGEKEQICKFDVVKLDWSMLNGIEK